MTDQSQGGYTPAEHVDYVAAGRVADPNGTGPLHARIAALEAENARLREERDQLQMYLAAGEKTENWNLAQQYRTERDEFRSSLATTCGKLALVTAERNAALAKVETAFRSGFLSGVNNNRVSGAQYRDAETAAWKAYQSTLTPASAEPVDLPIITCAKCGSKAAAFICSERGCPVNGGAVYG